MKFVIFVKNLQNMKALKSIILCLTILISYNAYSQEANTAELDKTIDKLIPKAKKNRLNEKQTFSLMQSYHQANEQDFKRIMELKVSGQPDIWIEIYHKSVSIDERQKKVEVLPDKVKSAINFKSLNLDNEIANAREKAELYICAKANLLYKDINDENLREARKLIKHLHIINPQSNNIDELMLKSVILPSKQIVFRVATPIEMYFPQDYAKTILNFDNNTVYGKQFDAVPDKDKDYDLMIRIMIDETIISPERIESVTFEEKKDNAQAIVTDKTMIKSATLKGKIQIIDVENDEVLINMPYNISSTFRHQYAEASGNTSACSEYTLELLKREHIDFPTDNSLLKAAARELNITLKNIFQKN